MISVPILLVVGASYYSHHYKLALAIVCYSIVNGALAALYAYLNPDWYWRKRMMAGLSPFDAGAGVGNLIATKAVILVAEILLAVHLAQKAGYL